MARELTQELRLIYEPAEDNQVGFDTETIKVVTDMTGDDVAMGTIDVGTTEETWTPPTDIGTAGILMVRNLDSTNFVSIGIATASYLVKVLATEVAMFRPTGTTLYLKADTAAVRLQYWIAEA